MSVRRLVKGWGVSFCAVLGFAASPALATPKTYRAVEFSPEFRATVTRDEAAPAGARITIFDRKSDKQVLSMRSPGLEPEMAGDEVAVNRLEFPYGPESAIFYRDFDFDGQPDLALQDGSKSCYGGPAYTVFLRRGAGFQQSTALTRLAHEYCGMFEVDEREHRLRVAMKSGCCLHSWESYALVAGAPRLVEKELDDSVYVKTTRHWPNGAVEVTYKLNGPDDGSRATLLFAFDLQTPQHNYPPASVEPQRVEVFEVDGRLDYVLLRRHDRRIQLSYQQHVAPFERSPGFEWLPKLGELRFTNGPYQYVVHDSPQHAGLSVHGPGVNGFVPALAESREGSQTEAPRHPLANVRVLP